MDAGLSVVKSTHGGEGVSPELLARVRTYGMPAAFEDEDKSLFYDINSFTLEVDAPPSATVDAPNVQTAYSVRQALQLSKDNHDASTILKSDDAVLRQPVLTNMASEYRMHIDKILYPPRVRPLQQGLQERFAGVLRRLGIQEARAATMISMPFFASPKRYSIPFMVEENSSILLDRSLVLQTQVYGRQFEQSLVQETESLVNKLEPGHQAGIEELREREQHTIEQLVAARTILNYTLLPRLRGTDWLSRYQGLISRLEVARRAARNWETTQYVLRKIGMRLARVRSYML